MASSYYGPADAARPEIKVIFARRFGTYGRAALLDYLWSRRRGYGAKSALEYAAWTVKFIKEEERKRRSA